MLLYIYLSIDNFSMFLAEMKYVFEPLAFHPVTGINFSKEVRNINSYNAFNMSECE